MTKLPSKISIKNWSHLDKPREKLRDKGKLLLSDAELIAIIIGSGNKEENAVELCKRILVSTNHSLNVLGKYSINQLMVFKGIGEAKAISIVAAMELGKRCRAEVPIKPLKIVSSVSVFNLMQPIIGELQHEEFWILYLNNANSIVKKMQLSKGGITSTLVDVRLVFKMALEVGAVAIILTHNHPSEILKPSQFDIDITKKLKKAGNNLDIKILDHVIITEKSYFSFADKNIL